MPEPGRCQSQGGANAKEVQEAESTNTMNILEPWRCQHQEGVRAMGYTKVMEMLEPGKSQDQRGAIARREQPETQSKTGGS